ncbi:ferredoxin [Clostridium saccharobutylicum]|uniref:4Fe-4S binding protein n=1 Tax=Clostridium saccharobutylicum TaxID=169679 RepID=UPI000983ADAD|nr:4Fe-4S binding protein [Clostridium saccharobutylicum]AQS11377.1 ferredoxin [Clostridium saccharobutylicum]MBC2437999.1 4Fe-4S binding protein [Clostridium saccharobutylicum]NSB88774.1 formate hydrogenlyase subunit 6/NADH:ubiquinone oxidoreductase subunit I [Clostridium saccharobutylicum]NYC30648.1 formate hydrogenlyase subunit 6/NADH:ubiquinone oxidoreductase subunit I [Clostridium saccharobutylicum]OOM16996.1 ferredoxin [Clostridium saccharobutylicum]
MPRKIIKSDCVGCGTCQRVCIIGCITEEKARKRTINESACVDCGACELACPEKCISQK